MPPQAPSDPAGSGTRRRGRPVSAEARDAVLRAAVDLLEERGLSGFSVDEVARRSKVSKSTIYKHWRDGLAIAVEAYGSKVTDAIPVTRTGDVEADLLGQVRRVAATYAGPGGRVIAQLLGAGAAAEGGPELVRRGFFAERRAESMQLVHQGVAEERWRLPFDPGLVIELLFGPIVFRAMNGGPPLSPDEAAALAETALRGLARPVRT